MPAFPLSPCALRMALASGAAALVLWTPALAQQAPRSLVAPAPSDLLPAQTATNPDLVQFFADWMKRHPIGSTVPPSQAEVLAADDLPVGLPALAAGRRYAVFDGMIVEIDAAWKLIRLVRRAPEPAPTPTPAPAPAPTAEAPAPAPTSGANATANANANVTVNIVTNDDGDEGEGEGEGEGDEDDAGRRPSLAITIEEAERRGIRIPRGHQPEAGDCRLWIPGTPPGRQPRGGADCDMRDIPEGAFLIKG